MFMFAPSLVFGLVYGKFEKTISKESSQILNLSSVRVYEDKHLFFFVSIVNSMISTKFDYKFDVYVQKCNFTCYD